METNDSKTIKAASRTYFFDLKQTKEGKTYLAITESRKAEGDQFERHRITIFPEDAPDFLAATQEMVDKLN